MRHLTATTHPHDPHRLDRSGWLRASILGANDGLISIAALSLGMVSAAAAPDTVLLTACAGLVAGAMSMAVGEYVSVASQADLEEAEHARERRALQADPAGEFEELVAIYQSRGLSVSTARQAAREMSDADALKTHLRDEIGLLDTHAAAPLRAALTSGLSFTAAGIMPIGVVLITPPHLLAAAILTVTLATLVILGLWAAHIGGASHARSVLRAVLCGGLAMAASAGAGALFGIAVP